LREVRWETQVRRSQKPPPKSGSYYFGVPKFIFNSYYDDFFNRVEYVFELRECSNDDLNTLLNNFRAEQNLMAGDTVVVSYVNFLFPEME